jgi:hypothetical protein
MHRLIRATLASLVLLAWHASSAFAWNAAGHQVSGAIAYQALQSESPQTVAKVVAILRRTTTYCSCSTAGPGSRVVSPRYPGPGQRRGTASHHTS